MEYILAEFIIVTWPESQELMDEPGFQVNSFLINDEKGLKIYGSSAYFVNKTWYENLRRRNSTL